VPPDPNGPTNLGDAGERPEVLLAASSAESPALSSSSLLRCAIVEGPLKNDVIELERPEALMIGRTVRHGLKLEDRALSRHHCVIEFSPPRCFLRDLNSRNGTFVNGRRMASAELHDRDEVRFGQTVLRIELVHGKEDAPTLVPRVAEVTCAKCGQRTNRQAAFASSDDDRPAFFCGGCRDLLAAAPEVFPGFRVVKKIGEGGMGAVFLASMVGSDAVVAIKTLRPELAANAKAVRMFLREAMLGASIDHPSAIRMRANGYANGIFYFIMDYVDGPDVEKYMKQLGRKLSVAESIAIIEPVLDVVEHAHRMKLVHRDIKPSNILLAAPPPEPSVRLADFGLMRRFEGAGFSLITKSGEAKGTPLFMPPEQLMAAKHAGPTADVYSLGATLFYMLAGEGPLVPLPNRLLMVLEGEVKALAKLNPDVPPALEAVVRRCLEKEKGDRYATVGELRSALLEAVG
jgi:serine/threonine-protein kinase